MKNDFLIAITQISAERHLPKEVVLEAIEQALVLAYKRNFGATQEIDVEIDPNTGRARVYAEKEVVEQPEDPRTQISVREARKIDAMAEIGSKVQIEMTPKNFGRIAAQTAKQVILQRIREAERETLYADWLDRAGEVVMGTVRNIDSAGNVVMSFGRAEAVMTKSDQIPTERYAPNQRLRVYIHEVERTSRGPRIKVSRTHRKLLMRLLEMEVPEVYDGTVEIKAIAREPGSRSKVAVTATQEGVDPVGACVGMRGVRIQNIVNELNGEKIDVVTWAPDEGKFVANALSPARVQDVWLEAESKTATVIVPDDQLSLAIGKEGQNARLAAKLTNWRVDIKSVSEAADEAKRRAEAAAEAAAKEAELAAKREAARKLLEEAELSLLAEEEAAMEPTAEAEVQPAEAPAPEAAVEAAEETVVAEEAIEPVLEAIAQEGVEAAPEVEAPAEEEAAVPEVEIGVAAVPEAEPEPVSAEPEEASLEAFVPEVEEEEEVEAYGAKAPQKKKRKQRDLILDEATGRMISRTRRKASRQRRDWSDWEDEE